MEHRYYTPKNFSILYGSGFVAGLVAGLFGYGSVNTLLSKGISHGACHAIFERTSKSCLIYVCFQLLLAIPEQHVLATLNRSQSG